MNDPNQLLDAMNHPRREEIDALCALILSVRPGLTVGVKWNAPNFQRDGQDLVTLRIQPSPKLQVILHRGAKVKDAAGFHFVDPAGLAKMAAPDRGVIDVPPGFVASRADDLARTIGAWLDAV